MDNHTRGTRAAMSISYDQLRAMTQLIDVVNRGGDARVIARSADLTAAVVIFKRALQGCEQRQSEYAKLTEPMLLLAAASGAAE